jgi:molybdate transport system substrate-binding protein
VLGRVVVLLSIIIYAGISSAEQRLMVFAGAASKPPTEEAAKAFEKKTGAKVDIVSLLLPLVQCF